MIYQFGIQQQAISVINSGHIIITLNLEMEEVLRMLYSNQSNHLQSQRIDKALVGEGYGQITRKKYNFERESQLYTRETSFSIDEEIRFEKEFYETANKQRQINSSIQPKFHELKLPQITKTKVDRKVRRKFRGAVWAVVFLNRLEQATKQSMLKRKRRSEKQYKHLLLYIDKLVGRYYQKLLEQQLNNYISILQNIPHQEKHELDNDILQVMYFISEKLAISTVTKDILEFFVLTATRRGFPPSDFLAAIEISKLQFSPKYGCLTNVTNDQTRMIIALGLGIKIFCFYIICQPWNLGMATEKIFKEAKQLHQVISNASSIFYFIILEQFCLKVKEIKHSAKVLASLGIRPIFQLDPFNLGMKENSSQNLVLQQNRSYLSSMQAKYPQVVNNIRSNIFKWISRIAYACLKSSENQVSQSAYNTIKSSRYSKLDTKRGDDIRENNIFKSVDIKPNLSYAIRKIKKTNPVPNTKRTID